MNMHVCNQYEKRCEVSEIMYERDVRALCESKLKGKREEKFESFKGIKIKTDRDGCMQERT